MEISAVVSYWNSTSNHNMRHAVGMPLRLYLIEILHQTTTRVQLVRFPLVLYLIEILHQTTTARPAGLRFSCCILLKFYIKPQLRLERELACCSCILLKFYIKPQQVWFSSKFFLVVSYWNSTSNHNSGGAPVSPGAVVSYWNSTSNHNTRPCPAALRVVVSYWNSTSNHNSISPRAIHGIVVSYWNSTSNHNHWRWDRSFRWVVSYWNSTSNHNIVGDHTTAPSLYLIEILHQTTTRSKLLWLFAGCILLKFYIKPQPTLVPFPFFFVVSYWNSTSNHNSSLGCVWVISVVSYWNSTSNHNLLQEFVNCWRLYLIEILHQTTTVWKIHILRSRCILLKFYIKPQHSPYFYCFLVVVSYWNSTSNHNYNRFSLFYQMLYLIEILHQTTTIALQSISLGKLYLIEILHQTTTTPVSMVLLVSLYLIEILHQTTTLVSSIVAALALYLIEILHQTTTLRRFLLRRLSCILLKFYIKPQQRVRHKIGHSCCILLKFYIKPQHECSSPVAFSSCILLKFYIKPQPDGRPNTPHPSCILLKFYIKPQLRTW